MADLIEKWVRQAQTGDKEAFIQLVESQKLSLTRAALAILHNQEDAADAVAETVLEAFCHLRDLRQPKYFRTWLMRVLINNSRDILRVVRAFFEDRQEAADRLGVCPQRLCFDPGVGFGKTLEENLRLIAQADRVKLPGMAFLMAASRKRVTGAFCGNPPFEQRLPATLAAHTAAILGGADLVRVHDVKEAVQAARMADALKTMGKEPVNG